MQYHMIREKYRVILVLGWSNSNDSTQNIQRVRVSVKRITEVSCTVVSHETRNTIMQADIIAAAAAAAQHR